jgi:hypothetical protein
MQDIRLVIFIVLRIRHLDILSVGAHHVCRFVLLDFTERRLVERLPTRPRKRIHEAHERLVVLETDAERVDAALLVGIVPGKAVHLLGEALVHVRGDGVEQAQAAIGAIDEGNAEQKLRVLWPVHHLCSDCVVVDVCFQVEVPNVQGGRFRDRAWI